MTTEELLIYGDTHKDIPPANYHGNTAYITQEHKIEVLARMLAGYDYITWSRLKPSRKLTYRRAGAGLLFNWDSFKSKMEEWDVISRSKQGNTADKT